MKLAEVVKRAMKKGKVVMGFKRSLGAIETKSPRLVVLARDTPKQMHERVMRYARISGVEVREFEGNSMELGVLCGKPFPVSTLVIMDEREL
jgi:large subunit ribosomal protein L30e